MKTALQLPQTMLQVKLRKLRLRLKKLLSLPRITLMKMQKAQQPQLIVQQLMPMAQRSVLRQLQMLLTESLLTVM